MSCLVCQDPKTVRSHLTPSAFVRDILGGHKHAFEGSRNIVGLTLTQSGIWDDDLLCIKHERALENCDVWRHAMSRHNARHDMRLGPWEPRLRQLIFNDARDYNPSFFIFRQSYYSSETELKEILIAPHRNPQFHRRAWQFYLGGLLWVLFLNDQRGYSKIRFQPANDSDPMLIIRLDERQITEWPGIVDIVANMASKQGRG